MSKHSGGFKHPQGGRGRDRGAVLIVILDGDKFALIQEPRKPLPHYWKFPAGRIEGKDVDRERPSDGHLAADNAAVREAKEETGLDVQVMRLGVTQRKRHTLYLYVGVADFSTMAVQGNDGEIPRAFTLEEIEHLTDFHPAHIPILRMAVDKAHQSRQ